MAERLEGNQKEALMTPGLISGRVNATAKKLPEAGALLQMTEGRIYACLFLHGRGDDKARPGPLLKRREAKPALCLVLRQAPDKAYSDDKGVPR